MKKLLIILAFIASYSVMNYAGDKTELKWKSIESGLSEAKKAKKKVFVDVYADWCKWCKKLDAEVFSNPDVAKYLNEKYVLVKLNGESSSKLTYKGEKMTEAEFAQGFGVAGFPTMIFMEPTGEAINKLGSFVNAEGLLPILKFIGDDHYKKMTWEEYVEKFGVKPKTYY